MTRIDLDVNATTSCVAFNRIEGTTLARLLDLKAVRASTGAACESRSHGHSHVLRATRVPESYLPGGVRFSFGPRCGAGDAAEACRRIVEAVRELGGR